MTKIALVPIDNRPVCYDLPLMIVKQAKEHEIIVPDIKLLGDLSKNADYEGLLNWLEGLNNIDAFVISLDTIAYGGLIPSRRSEDDIEVIKERINRLVEIIEKNKAKVYAFSSIMRISNNNVNEEEKEYWDKYGKKIFEYSYNKHKCEVEGISEPENDIPSDILEDYLNTRKRNFILNKYYIELYKKGIFNTLVFSKDDCAQFGLNVKEANELNDLSLVESGIFVKTGADEIPLTLISRALNKHKNIKVAVRYTNPEGINEISRYEDISVGESVRSQLELAGGVYSDEKDCDIIMLVNNFEKEQGELVMNVDVPLFHQKLHLPDKPYFIADIVNANGSDNKFVNELLKFDFLKEFYGYAGWNTTGNTLGSAISTALTYFGAKRPSKTMFRELQIIRFLDDWAYQANVRAKIRDDKNNLTNNIIQEEMSDFENLIFDKFELKHTDIKYEFPWNRFFEIKISMSKNYFNIPFVEVLFNDI